MNDRINRLDNIFKSYFAPEKLQITDESAKHSGHVKHGENTRHDGSGQTHLAINIISGKFAGLSRLEIHRLIMQAAKPEFDAGLHALRINARAK